METEQDLDLVEMSRYQSVAVTAGASTPHWLIGNVVNTLKHAWAFRPDSWIHYLYRVWRFILKSNLYVATGAGSLSYTSSLLQQVEPQFTYFFVAFFYVYAMHLLNHFTDKASKLNDPVQTMFYGRHHRFLLVTGLLSAFMALGLGAYLGLLPFIFVLLMSGIGLMYSFKVIPERLARSTGISRLKEIPGLQDHVHRGGLGGAGGPHSGGVLRTADLRGHGHRLFLRGRHDLYPFRPLRDHGHRR